MWNTHGKHTQHSLLSKSSLRGDLNRNSSKNIRLLWHSHDSLSLSFSLHRFSCFEIHPMYPFSGHRHGHQSQCRLVCRLQFHIWLLNIRKISNSFCQESNSFWRRETCTEQEEEAREDRHEFSLSISTGKAIYPGLSWSLGKIEWTESEGKLH